MRYVTRFEVYAYRALIYCFAMLSLVLAWISFVKLDSAKFEVIQVIKEEVSQLNAAHAVLTTTLDALQKEVEKRGEWIKVADTELTRQASEQVYRSEFQEWAQAAQAQNPELVVPELLPIPEKREL